MFCVIKLISDWEALLDLFEQFKCDRCPLQWHLTFSFFIHVKMFFSIFSSAYSPATVFKAVRVSSSMVNLMVSDLYGQNLGLTQKLTLHENRELSSASQRYLLLHHEFAASYHVKSKSDRFRSFFFFRFCYFYRFYHLSVQKWYEKIQKNSLQSKPSKKLINPYCSNHQLTWTCKALFLSPTLFNSSLTSWRLPVRVASEAPLIDAAATLSALGVSVLLEARLLGRLDMLLIFDTIVWGSGANELGCGGGATCFTFPNADFLHWFWSVLMVCLSGCVSVESLKIKSKQVGSKLKKTKVYKIK